MTEPNMERNIIFKRATFNSELLHLWERIKQDFDWNERFLGLSEY